MVESHALTAVQMEARKLYRRHSWKDVLSIGDSTYEAHALQEISFRHIGRCFVVRAYVAHIVDSILGNFHPSPSFPLLYCTFQWSGDACVHRTSWAELGRKRGMHQARGGRGLFDAALPHRMAMLCIVEKECANGTVTPSHIGDMKVFFVLTWAWRLTS